MYGRLSYTRRVFIAAVCKACRKITYDSVFYSLAGGPRDDFLCQPPHRGAGKRLYLKGVDGGMDNRVDKEVLCLLSLTEFYE